MDALCFKNQSQQDNMHTVVFMIFPIYMAFNCSAESTHYCVIRRNVANKCKLFLTQPKQLITNNTYPTNEVLAVETCQ